MSARASASVCRVRGASICEHGRGALSARSAAGSILQARSCTLSVQGVRRGASQARRVRSRQGVAGIFCKHDRVRSRCKECGGSSICEHGRQRSHCKECGGEHSASTIVLSVQGVRWVCNLRARPSAPSVQGGGGASICEHGRRRSQCKECGGASICEHGRQRHECRSVAGLNLRARPCGALGVRSAVGGSICEHGRALCVQGVRWGASASTAVSAMGARSAWVWDLRARSSALSQGMSRGEK